MSSSSNINLNEKKDDLQESIDDTSDSEFMNMAQKTDDEKIIWNMSSFFSCIEHGML